MNKTHSLLAGLLALCCLAAAPATRPASAPAKLPHIQVDRQGGTVTLDCEFLAVEQPLEFLCVVRGANEHESLLRTDARPSNLHLALLMLGLEPGRPLHFDAKANAWAAPSGPKLQMWIELEQEGKTKRLEARQFMRNVQTRQTMPARTWIFCGSRIMPDGQYAADGTGYVVSLVNFDLTPIDVPELASSDNRLLEWERDAAGCPPAGTPARLIIAPAGR